MTDSESEDGEASIIEAAVENAGGLVEGLPAPIKKSFWKAVTQLSTAAVDIGVAALQGKASDIRANSKAREKIIGATAEKITEKMDVPAEYAEIAVDKHAKKILREQINTDKTVAIAIKQLEHRHIEHDQPEQPSEISEDWLNAFQDIAGKSSSERMQQLFGKILAGEISQPSSFSIRSIKIIHELDGQTAHLFQKACSYSIGFHKLKEHSTYRGISTPSLGGGIGQNSLEKYELSFDNISRLIECGLVNPEVDLARNISDYLIEPTAGTVRHVFYYRGTPYGLRQLEENKAQKTKFMFKGAALTAVGRELFPVVDLLPEDGFSKDLNATFEDKKLRMETVKLS